MTHGNQQPSPPSNKLRGPDEQPLRPHDNCYWVIPGKLLASEYPGARSEREVRQRIGRYLDNGVNFFLDLTETSEPLRPYADVLQQEAIKRGLPAKHQRIPIVDMDVPEAPDMVNILDTIDRGISEGKTVCVHCWGGIGRTGTVIGCYLVRHGNSGEEALRELARLWQSVQKRVWYPYSPQTRQQQAYVYAWQEAADE